MLQDGFKVMQHRIQLDPAMARKGSAFIQLSKCLHALALYQCRLAALKIGHQFGQGLHELAGRVIPTVIAVRQITTHSKTAIVRAAIGNVDHQRIRHTAACLVFPDQSHVVRPALLAR